MVTNTINKKLTANQAWCLSECLAAYAMHAPDEPIFEFGYNPDTKFAYIALHNGVQIIKSHNTRVQYIATQVYNQMDIGERKFESYDEAEEMYRFNEIRPDMANYEFNGIGLSTANYEY
jgi:hypothetical protein